MVWAHTDQARRRRQAAEERLARQVGRVLRPTRVLGLVRGLWPLNHWPRVVQQDRPVASAP